MLNLNTLKMKTNEELQQDVEDAIKWEPLLHAAEIGVTARDGIVTLMGSVSSYSKKLEAENATKKVHGVRAIVEQIKVIPIGSYPKSDENIAKAALAAIDNNWSVPEGRVQLKVEDGWVYLGGNLPWNYQKEAAEKAVQDLPGVLGIVNNIEIKREVSHALEERFVRQAFKRHWALSTDEIGVHITGSSVKLTGVVHSLFEKEEAERLAWKAPGVTWVDNQLEIQYKHALSM
jgi:osmotically-inducible protein OsmY